MHNKYKTGFFLVLCTVMFNPSILCASGEKFYIESGESEIKLLWLPDSWDNDLMGFNIKRGTLGLDGNVASWKNVNSDVYIPSLSADRNLNDVHYDSLEQLRIKDLIKAEAVMAKHLTNDQVRQKFVTAGDDGMMGFGIRLKNKFDVALMYGFGCVIERSLTPGNQVYGLFKVDLSGNESGAPVAIVKDEIFANLSDRLIIDEDFKKFRDGIKLIWRMPSDLFDELGIYQFRLYSVAVDGSGKVTGHTRMAVGPIKKVKDGVVEYYTYAHKHDRKKRHYFALEATNRFQNVFNKYYIIYEPITELSDFINLEKAPKVSQLSGTGVKVSWEYKQENEKYITAFKVRRRLGLSFVFEDVSPLLPVQSREFVCENQRSYGVVHSYSVLAVGKDGSVAGYPMASIQLHDNRALPKPKGLTSKFVIKDGKRYVHLKWDPKEAGDTATDKYLLLTNSSTSRKFYIDASLGKISSNEIFYEVHSRFSRDYIFRLKAISKNGVTSDYIETTCSVSGKYMPAMPKPTVVLHGDGDAAKLSWSSQDLGGNLIGYRIYANAEQVADESQVKAGTTEWIITDLQKDTRYNFTIKAVGPDNSVSIREGLAVLRTPEEFGMPPKPVNFMAVQTQRGSKKIINFTWKKKEITDRSTGGYTLFRKVDSGEWVLVKNINAVMGRYTYVIPDDLKGKSVLFKLAGRLKKLIHVKGEGAVLSVDILSD